MFRWLLLGLLLIGIGVAVDKEWVVANWDRISRDLNLPDSNWTDNLYKDQEQAPPTAQPKPTAKYKTFRDLIKAE